MNIITLQEEHFPQVAQIYAEGLATGIASFETTVPTWEQWDAKMLPDCRFVAVDDAVVAGWCALSAVSKRTVYRGVAENTIYIAAKFRNKGYGQKLLHHLVSESEKAGYWTLQAGIFPENKASIALHQQCGFTIVGKREHIAQRNGQWFDNILMERRSKLIQ